MMMAPLTRRRLNRRMPSLAMIDAGTMPALANGLPDRLPNRLATLLVGALGATVLAALLLAGSVLTEGLDALLETLAATSLFALAGLLLVAWRQANSARETGASEQLTALTRAKQAAETANLAKSRYLAGVSHDIRSPLNAIYGYAQLFERGDGGNAQEASRVILRSCEHLTNLVEGLLDISQLEFGVLRVRSEEVQLGPFVDQIVAMMRPSAQAKGLTLHYLPPDRMPEIVKVDPGRVRQILINLLSNAIKFTDAGSVTLALHYFGETATFEVRDTGPGIAPQDHERVFERFEQVDGDAGDKAGAGLGLAISRTIVEILGGKLELESAPGDGATFRVILHMSEVAGKIASHEPVRHLIGYDGRQRTVLLVEDDADQRAFMTGLLDQLGFATTACPSGEAALDRMIDGPIDLAILDISLPGMSGWETGLQLRKILGNDLQILMLSANSEELHRPEFETPAHDRFLVKPVAFGTLADAIGDLLGLHWQWQSSAPAQAHAQAITSAAPLNEAARGHVAKLSEYLRIGYVRGIEAEVRQLEEAAPDAQPLVRQLYDCLDRYDLAGMARLLKEQ